MLLLETAQSNDTGKLKAGDILVSSWGYEQTNIDYYKVLSRTLKGTVRLVKVGKKNVTEDLYMQGSCEPDPEMEIGEPFTRRAKRWNPKGDEAVRIESYSYASKWTGKPDRWTSYA